MLKPSWISSQRSTSLAALKDMDDEFRAGKQNGMLMPGQEDLWKKDGPSNSGNNRSKLSILVANHVPMFIDYCQYGEPGRPALLRKCHSTERAYKTDAHLQQYRVDWMPWEKCQTLTASWEILNRYSLILTYGMYCNCLNIGQIYMYKDLKCSLLSFLFSIAFKFVPGFLRLGSVTTNKSELGDWIARYKIQTKATWQPAIRGWSTVAKQSIEMKSLTIF